MHGRASMKREKKTETIRQSSYFDVEQLILRPISYTREAPGRKKSRYQREKERK